MNWLAIAIVVGVIGVAVFLIADQFSEIRERRDLEDRKLRRKWYEMDRSGRGW